MSARHYHPLDYIMEKVEEKLGTVQLKVDLSRAEISLVSSLADGTSTCPAGANCIVFPATMPLSTSKSEGASLAVENAEEISGRDH